MGTPASAATGAAEVPSWSKVVEHERRYRVHDNKGKSETASNFLPVRGGLTLAGVQWGLTANHRRDALAGSLQTKHRNVVKKEDEIRRHKNGQTVMASGVGTESYGRTARAVRESSVAHVWSTRASGSAGAIVARQANQNKGGRDEAVMFCGNVGVATSAGQGGMRSSRRRILRWMDHLGLKVLCSSSSLLPRRT